MAVEVAKVELKSVQDGSGLEERILAGQFTADQVVAVVGKTEGNGGVNDFTRLLADHAFRRVLLKHGKRSEAEVATIPMVWSGGCDGVITPHATVFARNDRKGSADKPRLVIGTAMSAELQPEDIGRPRMVEIVAEGVKAAMKNAGIEDPKDVHYVQTKTPLLTIDWVENAKRRGKTVACEVHDSMGVSNGTTGLGIGVALGEISMPRAEQICKDLDIYSSVASCSSGVELTRAQIVLMGNKAGAGGRYRIGHSVMKDALDIDGIYAAIRNAGLELPDRPRAEDLEGRLRRPPPSPFEGGGGRRGGGGHRRPSGLRLGRRDAPGTARRRPGHRDRRRRRLSASIVEVAGHLAVSIAATQGRHNLGAYRHRRRAPRMEATARR